MTLVLQDCLTLSPATAEHLQEEIDTIEAGSDVTDVVGTYADLQAYDTSTLTDKDVIKVLDDETEDHAQTYYRWSASSRSFSYIGKIAKPAVDSVNGKTGAVVLDSNDVGALPLSGGTITGDLSFDSGTGTGGFISREQATAALSLGYRISGTNYPSLVVDNRGFMPKTNLGYNLGYSNNKWARVYSAKLNNGADIVIPNTAGTMALTSDIQYVQYSTMPTASSENLDKVVQYTGETTANYNSGYFYKCTGSATRSATASQTEGSGLTNISVNIDTFETQITTSGSYDFMYDDWDGTWKFDSQPVNLATYGITCTGTPNDFDTITVVYSAGGGFAWEQIDVQPTGSFLPDQTGHDGEFLTTDGTDASWGSPVVATFRAWGANE